jgi:hypothetical protein
MNATTTHLQHLIAERDHLKSAMEALRNKIEGLEIAINVISAAPPEPALANGHGHRVHVSETIIDLLRGSGEAGLKPAAAIELAARAGITLNRGSVYTLLNRLARRGAVVQEDARYKLSEFAQGNAHSPQPRLHPSAGT